MVQSYAHSIEQLYDSLGVTRQPAAASVIVRAAAALQAGSVRFFPASRLSSPSKW